MRADAALARMTRWRTIKRLKRLQHDPLGPLVYLALFGIGAYVPFVIRYFFG
ncbi:MAG TPA: hypothetical protein VI542_07030 [Candidatus Tectomicrobia bacterium]